MKWNRNLNVHLIFRVLKIEFLNAKEEEEEEIQCLSIKLKFIRNFHTNDI